MFTFEGHIRIFYTVGAFRLVFSMKGGELSQGEVSCSLDLSGSQEIPCHEVEELFQEQSLYLLQIEPLNGDDFLIKAQLKSKSIRENTINFDFSFLEHPFELAQTMENLSSSVPAY